MYQPQKSGWRPAHLVGFSGLDIQGETPGGTTDAEGRQHCNHFPEETSLWVQSHLWGANKSTLRIIIRGNRP